jgi:hypothetical protein
VNRDTARAYERLVAEMSRPRPGTSHAGTALVKEATERHLAGDLERCPQLRNRPGLPKFYVCAYPSSMFCPGCAMRANAAMRGKPEDTRCDGCGALDCLPISPMVGLTPTGLIVMGGLCETCRGAVQ